MRVLAAPSIPERADDWLVETLVADLGRVRLDDAAGQALLAARAGVLDLTSFGLTAPTAAFVRAAAEVMVAFHDGAVGTAELLAAVPKLPVPRQRRAEVLAQLYGSFQEELDRRRELLDGHRVRVAVQRVASDADLPAVLANLEVLELESRRALSAIEVELVLALARRAARGRGPRVHLRLPFARSIGVNASLESTFKALEAQAEPLATFGLEPFDSAEGEGVGRRIASCLFGGGSDAADHSAMATILVAAEPVTEAREVARRVRDCIDQGTPPAAIAVVVRTVTETTESLLQHLDRYGVPVRARPSTSLREAPSFQAIESVYAVLDRNFPREAFAGLLASRYLRLAERPQLRGVARLLREAGVRDDGGGGGYAEKLHAFVHRQRFAHPAVANERPMPAGPQAELVLGVIARLQELPEHASLAEHCRTLEALLVAARFSEACAVSEASAIEASSLLRLLATLPKVSLAAGRTGERLSRTEFRLFLADAAGQVEFASRPEAADGVELVAATAIGGREFEQVFVMGLTEGSFPARAAPHALLPDEDRLRLNGALGRTAFRVDTVGGDPDGFSGRQSEEPLFFYDALCAARSGVCLSYSRVDAQGREALRSAFVDEVERRLGVVPENVPLAPVLSRDRCRSPDELRTWTARETLASSPGLDEDGRDRAGAQRALGEQEATDGARWRDIRRRVAMERERLQAQATEDAAPGPYSGLADADDVAAYLQDRFSFPRGRPLTAKQLDEYGTCGFKSFAARVLKLRAANEAGDDADAGTRGEVLHHILEAFYSRLHGQHRLPLTGAAEERETLLAVAATTLDQMAREVATGHPQLWELWKEEAVERLQLALEAEQKSAVFPGLVPDQFELAVGTAPSESRRAFEPIPLPSPEGSAPIFLGGRIDRVDVGGGRAAVVDYKSARATFLRTHLRDHLLSSDFQLATYLVLVEAALGLKVVDAAFVSLRDFDVVRLSDVLAAQSMTLDDLLAPKASADGTPGLSFPDRVWQIVTRMRAGVFPVRPVECTYCDFAGVCRISASSGARGDS